MISNPQAAAQPLSLALFRYYVQRGRASALALTEHEPMVPFMRAEIHRLIGGADYLDDPSAVIAAWSKGFEAGVRERVSLQAAQDGALGIIRKDLWPADATTEDERAAARAPVIGTLHLPRRTKIGGQS